MRQLSRIPQGTDQKRLTMRFVPFEIRTEATMPRDGVQRFGVSCRVLPEIEPDQRQPEGGGPPQDVGQTALSDDALTCLDERSVAELKRLDELCRRDVGTHSRASRLFGFSFQQFRPRELDAERLAGGPQPISYFPQHRPVWFPRTVGASAKLRRCGRDGEFG